MKKRKKTARRKKGHFLIGSMMNVDRRQSPERRPGEVLGEFETCGACGNQKRRESKCTRCPRK